MNDDNWLDGWGRAKGEGSKAYLDLMANPDHLERLKRHPEEWNEWRSGHEDLAPDLYHADLSSIELRGLNLSRANLRESDLTWAHIIDCNLAGANLSDAVLISVNFTGSELAGVNFRRARLWFTIFGDTNLRDAYGLDACVFMGPSILDMRTTIRSGPLPDRFLWGCGFSEALISYLPSLINEPIQFYSCFISYSAKDQGFADKLYSDLFNSGVRCWLSKHDIQGGKKIHEQIDDAIRIYDRLLLILSRHSINSNWVKTEVLKARQREVKEARRMLFPVRLVDFATIKNWEMFDVDTGQDAAREIREYYIPDFSNWMDEASYGEALTKLVRDLMIPNR